MNVIFVCPWKFSIQNLPVVLIVCLKNIASWWITWVIPSTFWCEILPIVPCFLKISFSEITVEIFSVQNPKGVFECSSFLLLGPKRKWELYFFSIVQWHPIMKSNKWQSVCPFFCFASLDDFIVSCEDRFEIALVFRIIEGRWNFVTSQTLISFVES